MLKCSFFPQVSCWFLQELCSAESHWGHSLGLWEAPQEPFKLDSLCQVWKMTQEKLSNSFTWGHLCFHSSKTSAILHAQIPRNLKVSPLIVSAFETISKSPPLYVPVGSLSPLSFFIINHAWCAIVFKMISRRSWQRTRSEWESESWLSRM